MLHGFQNPKPDIIIWLEPILLYQKLVQQNVERLKILVVQGGVKNGQFIKIPEEREPFGAKVEVISDTCFFKQLYEGFRAVVLNQVEKQISVLVS
jgi:hypothetical protein